MSKWVNKKRTGFVKVGKERAGFVKVGKEKRTGFVKVGKEKKGQGLSKWVKKGQVLSN